VQPLASSNLASSATLIGDAVAARSAQRCQRPQGVPWRGWTPRARAHRTGLAL